VRRLVERAPLLGVRSIAQWPSAKRHHGTFVSNEQREEWKEAGKEGYVP
jgi:hypothetical protein